MAALSVEREKSQIVEREKNYLWLWGKAPVRRDTDGDGLLPWIDLRFCGLSHRLRGEHWSWRRRIGSAASDTQVHEWTKGSTSGFGGNFGVSTRFHYRVRKRLLTGSVGITGVEVE